MLPFRHHCLPALLLAWLLPFGAHASGTPHWVHYRLLTDAATLPKKVVVLPVDVKVYEVTAGDVEEEVPDWSATASDHVFSAVSAAIGRDADLQQVTLPALPEAVSAAVDEHRALYNLVVNTAARIGWEHKIRRFDYSIGPGLAELQRRTGADAVVMVYGRDYVSTAGRKAKAVAGNIPIVNVFTGPAPELGHSFIHIGMIDLKTGDLLWMNSDYRKGATTLREQGDTDQLIDAVFAWYPAIEKYRAAYVR